MKKRAMILLALLIVAFTVATALIKKKPSIEEYQGILKEITSVGLPFRDLRISDKEIFFMHGANTGRKLISVNLESGKVEEIVKNEVPKLWEVSQDNRYLAFSRFGEWLPEGEGDKGRRFFPWWNIESPTTEGIWLFDLQHRTLHRLRDSMEPVFESNFTWLQGHEYILNRFQFKEVDSGNQLNNSSLEHPERMSIVGGSQPPLTSASDGQVYFGAGEHLYVLNSNSGDIRPASEHTFSGIDWIQYSPELVSLLFCAYGKNHDYRSVWKLHLPNDQLEEVVKSHSYNCQWLDRGKGYAYVENRNNAFSLQIWHDDQSLRTNLFAEGGLINYRVGPNMSDIYMTASSNSAPPCIYSYNLTAKTIQLIYPINGYLWKEAKTTPAIEYTVEGDAGKIHVFAIAPVRRSWTDTQTKKPAVIYMPHPKAQYQNTWDLDPQLISNLGFYFIAINYRGCDGYGQHFASLPTNEAYKDILAVCNDLPNHFPIDPKRLTLMSISGGTHVLTDTVTAAPSRWRAIVYKNEVPGLADYSGYPPIFVSMGRHKKDYELAVSTVERLRKLRNTVDFVSLANMGHYDWHGIDHYKLEQSLAAFLLTN